MTKAFVLHHVHSMGDGNEDVKWIGVYSSRGQARATVARLSGMPGFSDAPEGHLIDEYPVDQDRRGEGCATLANAQ